MLIGISVEGSIGNYGVLVSGLSLFDILLFQYFIKLDQFCLAIHRIKYVIILLPFVALCKTVNIDYKIVNKAVVKMKRVLHGFYDLMSKNAS